MTASEAESSDARADVRPEVLVIGAGAVGLGLASFLLEAGRRVRAVGRPDTVAALRRGGLRRKGVFGAFTAQARAVPACASLDELPRRAFRDVLVAVKSHDSEATARALAARPWLWDAATRLVLCQNGWGNAEVFAARLPRERVFSARVITGFRRPAPNAVDVTVHADAVHLGSLFGADPAALADLARDLEAGGLPCRVTAEIARDLWAKMLYNCALNPLGAILEVPYGALGESRATRGIIEAVVREVFAVMTASGYTTHWQSAQAWLEDLYGKLLPPTAGHESSMLQDLRAGRRTEIDALSGAVVRLAEGAGLSAPTNEALAGMIRFLEARERAGR